MGTCVLWVWFYFWFSAAIITYFLVGKQIVSRGLEALLKTRVQGKSATRFLKRKKGVEIFCSSSLVFSSAPWAYVLAKTSIAESETMFCNFKATRVSLSSPSKEGYHYKILMERFLGNKTPTGFNGRRCADCGTMEFILKSGFPSYAAYSR